MATVAEPKGRTRARRGGASAGGGGAGAAGAGAALETLTTPKETTAAATTRSPRAAWALNLYAIPGAPTSGPWIERFDTGGNREAVGRVMDAKVTSEMNLDALVSRILAGGGQVTFCGPPGEQGGGGGSGGGGADGGGGSGPKRARTRTRKRSK